MMKWAALDRKGDDRPHLTLTLVEGTIVVLDLDKFEEYVKEHGLSEYSPNIVTGTLSHLVEEFARKWQGVIVYGLDWQRGTEEAIIEIPYVHPEELRRDLERIKNEINKLGARISIVAIYDYVLAKPARDRREAYYGTPARTRAHKLLKQIKREGGNKVVIMG